MESGERSNLSQTFLFKKHKVMFTIIQINKKNCHIYL